MLEQLLLKKGEIKLKMYQEKGHGKPHFHVDYGQDIHTASYAIETGERIEGSLHRKYDRVVREWTAKNREKLMNVWNALQKGQPEQGFILALGTMNSSTSANKALHDPSVATRPRAPELNR